MDELFDYDPSDGPGPAARERERTAQLLACYQQALGHELPNLLVSVQGMARLLASEHAGALDAEGRVLLDRLADLARRADALARATAAVGRACRDADSHGAVPLSEAAREALAEVNILSPGQDVGYDVSDDMPVLMESRRAVHNVLVQLLANASRAGLPGRPVRVTVSARRTASGVELQVADDGRGMPAVASRRLAEPFAAGSGHGLGLFVVRQLVAARGGALRISSEPGRGTTVTVLFREAAPQLSSTPEVRKP
jgi:signal transduction histidine kinase